MMIIPREITKVLNQFKRIHKRQIEPHMGILSPKLASQLKRKNLSTLNNIQMYALLLKLIREIDSFQEKREKPHHGIQLFRKEIVHHAKSIRIYLDTLDTKH